MHYLVENTEHYRILNPGDICILKQGDKHMAEPENAAARILVIEKRGSI